MIAATERPGVPMSILRAAIPRIAVTPSGPVEYADVGEGPAVVALHGAMGGWDQSLILALTVGPPGFRYIAVSRPGYLGTPMASGRMPEEEADTLAELLDVLDVPDVAVLAVSGGGPSAIHFGLRHARRCRGLVLISTASGIIDERIPLSFRFMKVLARVPFLARQMRRSVERDPVAAAGRSIPDPEVRRRTLDDPHAGPFLQALVLSTVDRMPERLGGTDRDIWVTRNREYELERISAPVLVIHGTADEAAPYSHAERLVRRAPTAELLTLEGGGHAGIFTHTVEVRPRVARFLSSISRTSSSSRSGGGSR